MNWKYTKQHAFNLKPKQIMERARREKRARRENFSNFQNSNSEFAGRRGDERWLAQQQIGVQSEGGTGSRVGKSAGDNKSGSRDVRVAQKDSQAERNITDKQSQRVFEHWFLLENEMVDAIRKGNSKLIRTALVRVDYLLKVSPPTLITECLQGDEEALWGLHRFLHNNGWWVKAMNLKLQDVDLAEMANLDTEKITREFIWANRHLVHPNTLIQDLTRDNDAVRMALNQIHYGSIRARRCSLKSGKKPVEETPAISTEEKLIPDTGNFCLKVATINFIFANKSVVDKTTIQGVVYNSDKAISDALLQIHEASLKGATKSGQSYKESLLASPTKLHPPPPKRVNSRPVSKEGGGAGKGKKRDIFFTGFKDDISYVDLWRGFKKLGRIKDVILPVNKDRSRRKYGFIKMFSPQEAQIFLQKAKDLFIQGSKISCDWANNSRKPQSGRGLKNSPKVSKDNPIPDEKDKEQLAHMGALPTDPQAESVKEWMERISRSVRIEVAMDYAPDSMSELLVAAGYFHLDVLKLGPLVFILTCNDEDCKTTLDLSNSGLDILSIRDVTIGDFILPRLTGIRLQGLPVCAYSDSILEGIVSRWGSLISKGVSCIRNQQVVNPQICISTSVFQEISESIEVQVLGTTYNVVVMEEKWVDPCSFDPHLHSPRMVAQSSSSAGAPSRSWEHDELSTHSVQAGIQTFEDVLSNHSIQSHVSVHSSYSNQTEGSYSPQGNHPQNDSRYREMTPQDPSISDHISQLGMESESELRRCDPIVEEIDYRNLRVQNWNIEVFPFEFNEPGGKMDVFSNGGDGSHDDEGEVKNTGKMDNWSVRDINFSEDESGKGSVESFNSCQEAESTLDPLFEDQGSTANFLSRLKIKGRGGRSRKVRSLNFFDFKLRGSKKKYKPAQWIPGLYVRPWNYSGKVEKKSRRNIKSGAQTSILFSEPLSPAEEIWNLGTTVGLRPLMSKPCMLDLITERLCQ